MPLARPTQTFLLFMSEGDVPTAGRAAMAQFVDALASLRDWQCGPPKHLLRGGDGEDADDTMGFEFAVFSAMPVGSLPRDLDQQAFDDVSLLLGEAARFSGQHHVTLELWQTQQVGEEKIGEIVDGVPDEGVRVGLLGEWKRVLDARRRDRRASSAP